MGAEGKHGQSRQGTFLGFPLRIVSLVMVPFSFKYTADVADNSD